VAGAGAVAPVLDFDAVVEQAQRHRVTVARQLAASIPRSRVETIYTSTHTNCSSFINVLNLVRGIGSGAGGAFGVENLDTGFRGAPIRPRAAGPGLR
jgi:hypothetical protein